MGFFFFPIYPNVSLISPEYPWLAPKRAINYVLFEKYPQVSFVVLKSLNFHYFLKCPFGVRGNNGTWAFRELTEKLRVISEFFSFKILSFIPSLIKLIFLQGSRYATALSYCFDYWKVTSRRFSCEIRKPCGNYHTCPFGYPAVYQYAIILVVVVSCNFKR